MASNNDVDFNTSMSLYQRGTRCWIPDDLEGWMCGTILSLDFSGDTIKIALDLDSGEELVFQASKPDIASKRKALPYLKNPPVLEGVDDLTLLSYLHEPAVLHNIRTRYSQQQVIYTYSGIVLIALNPFMNLSIYTPDIMREYIGKRRGELEPHLFAVAEEAYRSMIRMRKNQSIIVSGESGAGKTQSAKYIMRYFAIVDDLEKKAISQSNLSLGIPMEKLDSPMGGLPGMTEIEEAVLSTNPIMEAFGNAKTTRNDNSSRFGKYLEIQFSPPDRATGKVQIMGARMRTYLLERSRLIFQPDTERNYHIFYQICAAVPAAERKELALASWDQWYYLKQGKNGTIKGVDDASEFEITQKALSTIGIQVSKQWYLFRVCAALLHIGNIKIRRVSDDEATIDDLDPHMNHACRLLGLDVQEFKKWIIRRQISTRFEKIQKNLNEYQATVARDSIAKYIYTALFGWIVKTINRNLAIESPPAGSTFIGVLDIYGFEHFQKNSFEQFCINYANEKLQQEFNQHVFKLEQEEYVAEKINWSFIDFNDNQPCINMIEGRLGILDLLDEESRMPSGSDGSFIQKLYRQFDQHKFFDKPRFGQESFTVRHYAVPVNYDAQGFLEKNKDSVNEEQLSVLLSSNFDFFAEVINEACADSMEDRMATMGPGTKKVQKTLGSMFKGSLIKLMDTINSTEAHYIRCIKPNMAKAAFEFEPQMVLQQLRACGVLETIRISCAGYPSRWTYEEFADRYYLLIKSSLWKKSPKELTTLIIKDRINDVDKYQMGTTKAFMRAGMLAYLEKLRSDRIAECVTRIQKNVKRFVAQKNYANLKHAALTIQRYTRGMLARNEYYRLRHEHAALVFQKYIRRFLCRRRYRIARGAIIKMQRAHRARVMRRERLKHMCWDATVKIQATWRMYQARREYLRKLHFIVLVQSYIRRRQAKKLFRSLRAEAHDVSKFKEKNFHLENKVVELSRAVQSREFDKKDLVNKITDLENQLQGWKDKYERLVDLQNDREFELSTVKRQLESLREIKAQMQKELDNVHLVVRAKEDEIEKLKSEVEKQREDLKDLVRVKKAAADDEVVADLKQENANLKDQLSRVLSGKWKPESLDAQRRQRNANNIFQNVSPSTSFNDTGPFKAGRRVGGMAGQLPPKLNTNLTSPVLRDEEPLVYDEREAAILSDKSWEIEILDNLIGKLRIPLPSTQTVLSRRDIFYPAHIIGLCFQKLLKNGMLVRFSTAATSILSAIQALTMKFEDDYMSAFWLSNCYELSCVLQHIHDQYHRLRHRSTDSPKSPTFFDNSGNQSPRSPVMPRNPSDYDKAIDKARKQLDYVIRELYRGWMVELKKRLSNMIIPAVIENQSLPGYICRQSGGIWNRLYQSTSKNTFTIDQLLNFLSKLNKTMRCYYLDDGILRQIVTELFRTVGVHGFNHLLMRRNFCTWKRGVQIQYNVTRLEEWCKTQQIGEASIHLQRLLQAAKLFTLNKNTPQDVDTIFDVCFLLNPTQVQKLLSLYTPDEYETPLSRDVLFAVNNHSSNPNEPLMLDNADASIEEFSKPVSKPVEVIEKYMPNNNWLHLTQIKSLVDLE